MRSTSTSFVVLALATSLFGALLWAPDSALGSEPSMWAQPYADAAHTGFDSGNRTLAPSLERKWTHWDNNITDHTQAVAANSTVYVGFHWQRILDEAEGGGVEALDAKTGVRLWRFETDGWHAAPAYADGIIYSASGDGCLYALDANDGSIIWVFNSGSKFDHLASPTVANGKVYVARPNWGAEVNSRLYALDARTGELVWEFAGFPGYAFSPVVYEGTVYLSAGGLHAVDAQTGSLRWSVHLVQSAAPSVGYGKVFLRDTWQGGGRMVAFDANTGTQVWSRLSGKEPYAPGPAAAYGNLYYLDEGYGQVVCLDPATGHTRWATPIGTTYRGSVAVANGLVVAGTAHSPYDDRRNNSLCVMDALTGQPLWVYESSPNANLGSDNEPSILGDMVFHNVGGREFTAFGPPETPSPPPPIDPEPTALKVATFNVRKAYVMPWLEIGRAHV